VELRKYDRVQGLIFGAFGEVSDDVKKLTDKMAEHMGQRWRTLGASNFAEGIAVSKRLIEKTIGIASVRAYAYVSEEAMRLSRTWGIHDDDGRAADTRERASYDAWLLSYFESTVGLGSNIGL